MKNYVCLSLMLGLSCLSPICGLAANENPLWTYDAIELLINEGYITPPQKDIQSLSRNEMAGLTARALTKENTTEAAQRLQKKADELRLISLQLAKDEARLAILEQQYGKIKAQYMRVMGQIKDTTRRQLYAAMQSEDTSVQDRLYGEEKEHDQALQSTITALYQIKGQLIPLRARVARWKEKQETLLHEDVPDASSEHSADVQTLLGDLRVEYAQELNGLGYFQEEEALDMSVLSPPIRPVDMEKRFKIDGEIRYDYRRQSDHSVINPVSGKPKYPEDLQRFRARVYLDYNIDDNWHALGMIESEKALNGADDSMDGTLSLDRYYLQGYLGNARVTAGAFGTILGEGNIYDSRFKGAMVEYGDGTPWTFRARYGEVNEAERAKTLSVSYDRDSYGVDGGLYQFRMVGGSHRNIEMVNFRKPIGGWLHGGLMYLHGSDDAYEDGHGYVVTLQRGEENSWKKDNVMAFLKYYHQPRSTYIEHTMNGMADYMNGFKGVGAGLSYTLQRDLVASLEYYHLKDLTDHDTNNTIWFGLSYYFNNHSYD